MLLTARKRFIRASSGFTLVEALISLFIVTFMFAAAVSVYAMGWRWWAEISPRIEAQRIARVALSSVIDGRIDATAGTYTIGSTVYGRRNGIAQRMLSRSIRSI